MTPPETRPTATEVYRRSLYHFYLLTLFDSVVFFVLSMKHVFSKSLTGLQNSSNIYILIPYWSFGIRTQVPIPEDWIQLSPGDLAFYFQTNQVQWPQWLSADLDGSYSQVMTIWMEAHATKSFEIIKKRNAGFWDATIENKMETMGQVSKHCGEWHPAENISSWKILEEKPNFGRSHAVWSSLSPVCGNCFQRLRSIWWAMEDHRPLETLEVSFCNVAICMFGFYWRMVLWWSYGSNMIWFWMWNLDPQHPQDDKFWQGSFEGPKLCDFFGGDVPRVLISWPRFDEVATKWNVSAFHAVRNGVGLGWNFNGEWWGIGNAYKS